MTLIILEPLASSRERDVFLFTIGEQGLINEFALVIGIQSQDRKRKTCSRLLQGTPLRVNTGDFCDARNQYWKSIDNYSNF